MTCRRRRRHCHSAAWSAKLCGETPELFRSVVDINLNGAYWMAQACSRVMQPGNSIVNIGSVLGPTTAGLPQAAYRGYQGMKL